MHTQYRMSNFCIYRQFNTNDLILYDSLNGIDGINIVKEGTRLLPYLEKGKSYEFTDNEDFKWLIKNRYLIDCTINEKAIRDARKAHFLENTCLYLTIYVTKKCNFKCIYCANNYESEALLSNTQKDIISFIQKNIHRFSGIYISWFGGEPLLEVQCIEKMSRQIIEICKKNKKPLYADLTTNGYMLKYDIALRLSKCKVREICITLDGNKSVHDKMRKLTNGAGTYEDILKNLLEIKNGLIKLPIKIVIRMNMTRSGALQFQKFYNELDEKIGDDDRFRIYLKLVRNWGGEGIKTISTELLSDKNMSFLYNQYVACTNRLKLEGGFNQLEFGGMSCSAMKRNYIVVHTNGMVSKCERVDEKNIVGRIMDHGVLKLQSGFEEWNGIAYKVNEECDECPLSTLCFGGTCPRNMVLERKCEYKEKMGVVYDLLQFYAMLKEGEEWDEKNI